MTEPQKLSCVIPVAAKLWANRTTQDEAYWQREADLAMNRMGKVVSEVDREVRHEATIDGLRLHNRIELEDGTEIELPETVLLRFSAMALPHKETGLGENG